MPASKAQRAKTADRRGKAIALRLAGMDWQTIADRLDYASRAAACVDVNRALEANLAEQSQAADTLREVESQRLDRLQAAAWPSAVKGDLKAIETVLKVIDRRVKLQGLDMPLRAELSGPDGGPMQLQHANLAKLYDLIDTAGDEDPDDLTPITGPSGTGDDEESDDDGPND